jgi:hypothetical protein
VVKILEIIVKIYLVVFQSPWNWGMFLKLRLWVLCVLLKLLVMWLISLVPLRLQKYWFNCLNIIRRFCFQISHIFWENINCTDKLVNHSLQITGMIWWSFVPSFIFVWLYPQQQLLSFFISPCMLIPILVLFF